MDDPFTVADKIEDVLKRTRAGERFTLSGLFGQAVTRNEITCTFLAILELIRLHQIRIRQPHEFGDIEISAFDPNELPPVIEQPELAPAPVRKRRKKEGPALAEPTATGELSDPSDPTDPTDADDEEEIENDDEDEDDEDEDDPPEESAGETCEE